MKEFEEYEAMIHALIIDDLDGSISAGDKQLLRQWRNAAAANEIAYQDFLNIQQSIDRLSDRKVYDEQASWESLDKKLEAANISPVKQLHSKQPGLWYKIAAAVVLILSLGYYFIQTNKYITVSTKSNAAITRIILPDGTEVNLNAATQIRYPKSFLSDRKLELITGEVFIQVVKHHASQFRVDLGDIVAEDIGTSFNVRRDAHKIAVIVADGKVVMQHLPSAKRVMLIQGKLGVYDAGTQELTAGDNANVNFKSWIDKRFIFQDVALNQVAAQLEKVYQMPVKINGPGLKKRKLTARLQYQTLDSALAVISASLQCKVTKAKDSYVLSDN